MYESSAPYPAPASAIAVFINQLQPRQEAALMQSSFLSSCRRQKVKHTQPGCCTAVSPQSPASPALGEGLWPDFEQALIFTPTKKRL